MKTLNFFRDNISLMVLLKDGIVRQHLYILSPESLDHLG